MANEILSIPEEHLPEVIAIIMVGMANFKPTKEVKEQLLKWCKETKNYIGSTEMHDKVPEEIQLSASEAVYGFAAWLSYRKEPVIFSSHNNCAIIADLVDEFCKTNNLKNPRNDWQNNLIHPSEKTKDNG